MLMTALVTPFAGRQMSLDLEALRRLLAFQLAQGVDQILLAGTTGECAALSDGEYEALLAAAIDVVPGERLIAGLGAGRVEQVVARGRCALSLGITQLLLADCPYSGASSTSLRTHWHGPIAVALPEARLIAYAVPSRTGTELLPDDLARLAEDHPNVIGVKDATGRLARMERVRSLCGEEFLLICGDDRHARSALLDPSIRAQGCFSVLSNLVPEAMVELVVASKAGEAVRARQIHDRLKGLFGLGQITVDEAVEVRGEVLMVPQRVRNPVPLKQAMQDLGLLSAGCRAPLGGLGPRGREVVAKLLAETQAQDPGLLAPLKTTFGVDASAALQGDTELVGGIS